MEDEKVGGGGGCNQLHTEGGGAPMCHLTQLHTGGGAPMCHLKGRGGAHRMYIL